MADKKISALTPNTSPTGSEEFVYAYNNSNGKITLDTMKTFASADSQPTLVSGTNIKTVNGTSLLGSGDITVSGGQGTYDCVVAADGTGDYTTLYAAFTAGKRNVFIKNGTYNETPLSVVDDSFNIVGESPDGTILNYSITAGAYQTGGACITFTTSTKTNTTDIINHNISGVTFNIAETGSTDNTSGYLINGYAKSSNPIYTCNVDNCNINVTQDGANIRYYDYILGGNITFSRCNISVNSENYDTNYYGGNEEDNNYSISSARYIGCTLNAVTASNNYVTLYPTGISLIGCKIAASSTGTGNVSVYITKAYGSCIESVGTTSGITLSNSSDCKVRVDGGYSTNLTYSDEVDVWASNTAYSVGDFVQLTGIYECTTAHTSGDSFDSTNWSYVSGSSINGVENCEISIDGLLYIMGVCSGNNISASKILLVGDDEGNNPGAIFTGNESGNSNTRIKVVGQTCICSDNLFKSTYGIRYNDGYHIIKNNILQSSSSSNYPTVAIVGTNNNNSKVSDNILRYWQD